ncbi:MAG: DNA polymerase III subunit gamma/tau [Clostridia bacterium]|nr:DNA polymerase III subunit gamma/tau [Clostridia bacterium]
MAYQALYRKWRPSTFSEIVGQEHITLTLQNEIKSGKIAQAYLFCGSRGTGKTTTARVFSKAVNCLHPKDGNPCNECSVCRGIADGSLMDIVEIDAASNNGVDNIRTINSEVSYLPSGVTYKIYIIDEVHMLSGSAFNALLKTLEEPPSHVIFILATTESHKIPATILSRCQRFDFKRISQSPMLTRLKTVAQKDGIQITDEALSLIMKSADGSMRDALSLLDQCSSGSTGEIDADWVRAMTGGLESSRMLALGGAILEYHTEQVFLQVKQAISRGIDAVRLLEGLMEYFRNLIVCKSSGAPAKLIELPKEELAALSVQAEGVSMARCLTAMETLSQAYDSTRWAKNTRLVLEMALIQLSHPKAEPTNLLTRVERLEEQMTRGGVPRADQRPPAGNVTAEKILDETIPAEKISPEPTRMKEKPAEIRRQEAAEEPLPSPQKEPEHEPVVSPPETEAVAQSEKSRGADLPKPPESEEKDCTALITAHWPELLEELERQGNPLLSGALRSGEFRVKGRDLFLLEMLPMMDTPQNQQMIQQAIREICGVDMSVSFVAYGQSVPEEASAPEKPSVAGREKDELRDLAQHLANKINIIS